MTQDECEVLWIKLRSEMVERIRLIDKETPATPQTEPEWWLKMMNVLCELSK